MITFSELKQLMAERDARISKIEAELASERMLNQAQAARIRALEAAGHHAPGPARHEAGKHAQFAPAPYQSCGANGCTCGLIWSVPLDAVIAHVVLEDESSKFEPAMALATARLFAAAPDLLVFVKHYRNQEIMRGQTNSGVDLVIAQVEGRQAP